MTMAIEELPEIDLTAEAFLQDPEVAVADIRDGDGLGIARSARGVEVLRHDDCQELYRDTRFGQGTDDMYEAIGITEGAVYETFKNSLVNIEDADHVRQRQAVMPFFTATQAQKLGQKATGWINEWLDAEQEHGGSFDFQHAIARRLPSSVFCDIVGTSPSDSDEIASLSEQLMLIFTMDPAHREVVLDAYEQIERYMLDVVAERTKRPGEDFVSALLAAEKRGQITRDELMSLGILMLFGSTDTTTAQICMNMTSLADQPEAWQQLKADPDLAPSAVNELMRWRPGAMSITRVAGPDAEFHGIDTPEGITLWVDVFSGNKDPRAYEDPRTLDVARNVRPSPLNFGMGRHSCLGRNLSLVEQEQVLRVVLERWTSFEVVGEPPVVGAPIFASMPSLPLCPSWA